MVLSININTILRTFPTCICLILRGKAKNKLLRRTAVRENSDNITLTHKISVHVLISFPLQAFYWLAIANAWLVTWHDTPAVFYFPQTLAKHFQCSLFWETTNYLCMNVIFAHMQKNNTDKCFAQQAFKLKTLRKCFCENEIGWELVTFCHHNHHQKKI